MLARACIEGDRMTVTLQSLILFNHCIFMCKCTPTPKAYRLTKRKSDRFRVNQTYLVGCDQKCEKSEGKHKIRREKLKPEGKLKMLMEKLQTLGGHP